MKTLFPTLLSTGTLALLSGCATPDVTETQANNIQGLPQPSQVLVSRFAFSANDLTPNQAITARMNNSMNDVAPQTASDQVGLIVAQGLQNSLVSDLKGYGILTSTTAYHVVPAVGTLVIEGELLTLNEGNSYQRFAAGLGAGQSKVVASVSAYMVTKTGLVNMIQFSVDAKKTVKPDFTTTTAAVIPITSNSTLLTAQIETAQTDARHVSKQIAAKLNQLFVAEGWTNN